MSNLGNVEKKVLGALLLLCNEEGVVVATKKRISEAMGYKNMGGSVTYAIKALEMNNYIANQGNTYKILI